MRRIACIGALAVCAALAAAPAQAGKVLSFERARGVTELIAEQDCEADPACDAFAVGRCRRQAIRRIWCAAVNEDLDGPAPTRCTRRVRVRLLVSGDTAGTIGESVCAAILPRR